MQHLTKKYIFECKLKGEPVTLYTDSITNDDILLLVECNLINGMPVRLSGSRKNRANLSVACYPLKVVYPFNDHENENTTLTVKSGQFISFGEIRRKNPLHRVRKPDSFT